MRALLVVVLEPRPQGLPGFIQCLEVMKPETLLFHSSDQSLNHPVLLRGVGTDELLFQTVLVHRMVAESRWLRTVQATRKTLYTAIFALAMCGILRRISR